MSCLTSLGTRDWDSFQGTWYWDSSHGTWYWDSSHGTWGEVRPSKANESNVMSVSVNTYRLECKTRAYWKRRPLWASQRDLSIICLQIVARRIHIYYGVKDRRVFFSLFTSQLRSIIRPGRFAALYACVLHMSKQLMSFSATRFQARLVQGYSN